MPPAWYISGATNRPAGFRSASTGVFRDTPSKSSIVSLTPTSRATARRWSTTLVEPPVAIAPAMPFRKAFRVRIWRGATPFRRSSITSWPVSKATSSLGGSTAGMPSNPIGEMPIISNTVAIVLAVYWPPQAPAPGQARLSMALSSAAEILPAL